MKKYVTLSGGKINLYFQPESDEDAAALDAALSFEGNGEPLFFQTHASPNLSHKQHVVGEIGGHEGARWILVDITEVLKAAEHEHSELTIELLRTQADMAEANPADSMECTEEMCRGKIDFSSGISTHSGCAAAELIFPCCECGRLYRKDGTGVIQYGKPAYLRSGIIVLREKDGSFQLP